MCGNVTDFVVINVRDPAAAMANQVGVRLRDR